MRLEGLHDLLHFPSRVMKTWDILRRISLGLFLFAFIVTLQLLRMPAIPSFHDITQPPMTSLNDITPPPMTSLNDITPAPMTSLNNITLSPMTSLNDITPPPMTSLNDTTPPPMTSLNDITPPSVPTAAPPRNHVPLILMGNTYFGNKDTWANFGAFQKDQSSAENCSYTCEISTDLSRYGEASLVVVSLYNVDTASLRPLLTRAYPKIPGQKWAFFALESPMSDIGPVPRELARRLDWSITYRLNSSFPTFYDAALSRINSSVTDDDIDEAIHLKRYPIAAVISNPTSHRLRFIEHLNNYIPVHVYGQVTGRECPGHWECREKISRSYWFYLAIENAVCEDYVTEKLFEQFPYFIVPISVAGNWSDSLAPRGSFIRYNSTTGVKALAKYLHHLMHNPTEYRQFFQWKKRPDLPPRMSHHTCRICQALHQPKEAPPSMGFSSSMDFLVWYNGYSHCDVHHW
ncbi:unnamed protein product [Cyprideis torosa]|uniref:Fucosyltransferase n=1 Tax=Cyprideis torosa TaxID=163714 RepID=A0A7R8W781_9CRUS|nr:unnamed protein product [Cyprideis torosa]CAG0882108.1 unnamed protein product [Cyprideis torosa]